jgi:DNA ligase (NAD+)
MSIISDFSKLTPNEQYEILLNLQEAYENGAPEVDDATFDTFQSIYEKASGNKFKKVGAEPRGVKITLPYYMGSLDKIKGKTAEADLIRWKKTYSGPWVVEDKMDGISALYVVRYFNNKPSINLYTRGNGIVGTDISHLLEYIEIPVPDFDIVIRGELIIHEQDFQDFKEVNTGFKNSRNTAAGLINSKDVNVDIAKLIKFYAYNIVDWPYDKIDKTLQMKYLQAFKFNIPWYIEADELKIENLEAALKLRRKEAPYEIDGLVITNNGVYELEAGRNPRYVIAFKVDKFMETKVIDVIWEASKDGVIKPVVIYEPVEMSGVKMTRASGKNAKFIVNKGIGPGATILITRAGDVIPDIVDVITPVSKEGLKLPSGENSEYDWNDSMIEFILKNKESSSTVQKERIEYFFKTMDIKNVGPGKVSLLYENGLTTLYDFLTFSPDEVAKIKGMGFKSADVIYNAIQNSISSAPLAKVMAASGVFGPGFGVRKMEMILEKFSNILEMSDMEEEELISLIQTVEGFDKMSEDFVDKLPEFVEWLNKHNMIKIKQISLSLSSNQNLLNEKIVFTGFRSEELEKQIKEHGGSVSSMISKNTTILVAKNLSDLKTKGAKAEELGIKIMDLESFKKAYSLT